MAKKKKKLYFINSYMLQIFTTATMYLSVRRSARLPRRSLFLTSLSHVTYHDVQKGGSAATVPARASGHT